MKRPMLFLNYSGSCYGQTGNDRPVCTPPGALITDDRYLSLGQSPRGQLLVVPKGANTQAFLVAGAGVTGFTFYSGGEAYVEPAPALTLPLLNPMVSGSYPVPNTFKYLVTGSGEPANWRHLAAPSSGDWIVSAKNGSFYLSDAGSIPGIDVIGASSLTTEQGAVLTIIADPGGDGYIARRLAVLQDHPLVGNIDSNGVAGYHALPSASPLKHPLALLTALRCYQFSTVDAAGNDISGGIEQANATGTGAITDGVNMIYSPSLKRLFRAPQQTISFTQVQVGSGAFTPTASYMSIPGGHGAGVSQNYNYPNVRVDFFLTFSQQENVTLGLFRDGLLLQEFSNGQGSYGTTAFAFFFIDQSNPLGAHTYDVRIMAGPSSTTAAAFVLQSVFLIATVR